MNKKFSDSFERLGRWIDTNGYAGYDPYDVKGIKPVIKLAKLGNRYKIFEIIREIFYELFLMFPVFFRKVFRITKKENAKAIGLMTSSFIDLYQMNPSPPLEEKISKGFAWLKENKVVFNGGIGWGYPFDWQSSQFIPALTPNGIVTTAVAEAYWKKYKMDGDEEALSFCVSIAKFLFSLPKHHQDDERLCFSYTPLFVNRVHNLNLFVAEHLLKVGMEISNQEYIDTALKAVNFNA
ncbi:MAG: hypothetical protein AAGA77_25360, partial [Bacteroidota bacterium]